MGALNRRRLLEMAGAAAGFLAFGGALASDAPLEDPPAGPQAPLDADSAVGAHIASLKGKVAVARNAGPYHNTINAITLLGGMKAFLPPRAHVVVKPNIAWNRPPAACANTNPDVVLAVVEECIKAGARKVEVYDRPCEDRRRTYARSGIAKAAKAGGGKVRFLEDWEFVETAIPGGRILKNWPVAEGVFAADAFINVPIAKDHDTATLTMAMKNLMGVMGGNRGRIHTHLGQKLADFSTCVVPTLNILDANSILVAGGPQGGTPEDIRTPGMVIAGVEAATVDAFAAANLPWEIAPGRKVAYLEAARDMDIGTLDVSKIRVIES
ncbi:MAG: DUF362 domain-containing protein [Planctomycetes bacterium]|nr:DUF362 domain-containing protein [Planctomycetota bacterium]